MEAGTERAYNVSDQPPPSPVDLIKRYRRLSPWNKTAFWASVATIVGLPLSIALANRSNTSGAPDAFVGQRTFETPVHRVRVDFRRLLDSTAGYAALGLLDDLADRYEPFYPARRDASDSTALHNAQTRYRDIYGKAMGICVSNSSDHHTDSIQMLVRVPGWLIGLRLNDPLAPTVSTPGWDGAPGKRIDWGTWRLDHKGLPPGSSVHLRALWVLDPRDFPGVTGPLGRDSAAIALECVPGSKYCFRATKDIIGYLARAARQERAVIVTYNHDGRLRRATALRRWRFPWERRELKCGTLSDA